MDIIKLLPHLFEAAYVVDENRKILYCNEMFEIITGYKKEEVINKYCFDNILRHVTDSGKQLCHDGCPLQDSIEKDKINSAKIYLHHKKGYRVPVNVKTIPYVDEKTGMKQAIEIFTDLKKESTVYKENRKLKKNMMVDELTQVFNRRFIDYQLKLCINEFHEFEIPFGLLFIDVDHFKDFNDNYGHDIGDKVLKTVTKSISLNIRKEDFVGRYGGEEFVVILRDVELEEMRLVAEKLRSLISTTHTEVSSTEQVSVTVSIGCSYYKKDMSKEDFVKEADSFMYKAKNTGRNKVVSK